MSEIRVELLLADGSYTSGMLRAGQSLRDFEQQLLRNNKSLQSAAAHTGRVVDSVTRLDHAHKGFVGTVRDLSIITGVLSLGIGMVSSAMKGWFGEIVRVNAEMQRLQVMMRGMARSSEPFAEAAENVRYLREMAMTTPFSIQALANSFVKLQSTGIDPMAGAMQSLADGIAGFGGSDEQFNRATVAITQMSGKGVIQMEELRQQLGEHMPRAVELMARSMGMGVAELLDHISKGTVAAKPALEAMYAELDRVYGGRAKAMMQTFDGQMRQTTTLWQNLITAVGGLDLATGVYERGGFFMTVTDQLRDLNQVLASPMATGFAESVGQGLTQLVLVIRDTIGTLVTFRREILTVATVAAGAFVFRSATTGIGSLVNSLGTLRNEMKIVRLEMLSAGSMFATGTTGMRSMTTAGVGAQMMLTGVAMGVRGVGSAIMVAMPWVGAIGLAVYAAAEYFDIFGNRVQNALKDLQSFGAETRKQAEAVINDSRRKFQADVDSAARQLAEAQDMMGRGVWMQDDGELDRLQAWLDDAKQRLEDFNAEAPALIKKGADREDEKAAAEYMRMLEERMEASQRAYDAEAVAIQQDIDARKNGHEIQEDLEAERRERLFIERQKQLEANKVFLEELQGQNRTDLAAPGLDEDARRKLEDQRAMILAELTRTYTDIDILTNQGVDGAGIQHLLNPEGGVKALEKGESALKDIQREIMQMQLELRGATGAAAELETAIASGDYGSLETAGAKALELHDKLRMATRQKEALDKLMAGRSEAEKDAERARQRALEDQVDILVERKEIELGRKLTLGEINNMKLDAGLYPGMGSEDKINTFLDGIVGEFGNIQISAGDAGLSIRDNFAGDQSLARIQSLNLELARFNSALGHTSRMGDALDFGMGVGGITTLGPGGPAAAAVGPAGSVLTNTLSMVSEELSQFHNQIRGKANLMSSNPSTYGANSQTKEWQAANLTSISTASGMGAQVHKAAAAAFQGFIAELEGTGYKINSLGGYNYRNKVRGSTLSEHAFGNAIDINPAKNPFGDNLVTDMPSNISAMAARYGLSWGGDWKNKKDAMHFEWTGLIPPGAEVRDSNSAMAERTAIVQQLAAASEDVRTANNDATDIALNNQREQMENNRLKLFKDINEVLGTTSLESAEAGDQLKRVYDAIQGGDIGASRDISAPEYADIIAKAREADALTKSIAETKQLTTTIDQEAKKLEEERLELNRQLAEAQKMAADPNYVPESSTLRALETRLDTYISDVRNRYGEESEIYRQALATRQNMLTSQLQIEATNKQASLQKELSDQDIALMTQTQRRQHAMQQQLLAVDQWIAQARAAGMEEVEIVRQAEAMKAQIRQQHAAQMDPLGRQMQEWGDLQGQLAQKSTQWMDSLAGGITDLIMGTGDLRSVIQGIAKDMINMLVKYAMSGMKGGGQVKGGGQNKMGKMASTAKKGIGVMHAGGIVGGRTFATRQASASVFAGAPRFHTGGVIGQRLLPSEVPIIAQKGEGVFTEEQMKNLQPAGSGGQVITISSPITVHGSSGTPEQNTDLAKKMRREMEVGMRSVVADELRKQTKAGNMMNTRSR